MLGLKSEGQFGVICGGERNILQPPVFTSAFDFLSSNMEREEDEDHCQVTLCV